MSLTSTTAIPNTGGNSPNAVTFYMSQNNGVTYYRYDEGGTGVIQMVYTDFRTSDAAGTNVALTAGVPAKILAAGLEINGNGTITTTGNISTTGSVTGANLPAKILSGTVIIPVAANSSAGTQQTVTFTPSGFFTAAPRVTLQSIGTGNWVAYAPSTPGSQTMAVNVANNQAPGPYSNIATNITVHWIAVQE